MMQTEAKNPGAAVRSLGALFLLMLVTVPCMQAQVIILKTGQKVEAQGLRRDRDIVMAKVQVGTGTGEVGYNISQIARIEFPEPGVLKTASELLAQRQPDKALAQIDPTIVYYEPFKDVTGGWWGQAALLKVSILAALQRDDEAQALVDQIQKTVTDPKMARAVRVRLASGLIRKKEFEKAMVICDAALKESTEPEILAEAWIEKGDALSGLKQWDEALLAYLHVPVFYNDESTFLPPALLGSARAYAHLDDATRAKKSLNNLIASYPNSSEAVAAKTELQKMQSP